MSVTALHIAIVGFGTAGQAAAVLLARDGHKVEIFEQTREPGPVGAGVLLQPVGLQVLWEMGLLADVLAHGRRVNRLHGETASGRTVMDMRYARLDGRMSGLGMQRGALFAILGGALGANAQLHCGQRIVEVSDDGRRIRDEAGHSHGPFDLVIAADGSASCLRDCLGRARMDRPYPWGALWCLVEQGDWPHPDELRQRYVKARKMIGLLPVGTRPGDDTARLSFFWSLPTAEFDAWSARGLDPWLADIEAIWPQARQRMHAIDDCQLLSRASYRDAIPLRWHRNRLVLLGDAAHAMSPQLGQGVNMALLDARALREALRASTGVEAALDEYARSRRRQVSAYQFWSRWLTPVFQSRRDLVASIRDIGFHPMGRVWGIRALMLRVLSGTQLGLIGRVTLPDAFLEALAIGSESDRRAAAIN
jgi:2-polyprenyl-6-methoxyphenol hydroxylase-like FAD-dependent oxidoreductase